MIHYRSMTQICQLCKLITGHWPDSLASHDYHDCDVDILACAPSPTHTDETTRCWSENFALDGVTGNMAATENQCSCWRLRLPWWRGGGPAIRLYRSAMYRLSPYLHIFTYIYIVCIFYVWIDALARRFYFSAVLLANLSLPIRREWNPTCLFFA